MNEPNDNPYAPPSVETTTFKPNELLFEHRSSSRNIWTLLGSTPVIFGTAVLISQVAGSQEMPSSSLAETASMYGVCAGFIALSAFLIACLIVPRVWEFRVDREFVSWTTPWPFSVSRQVAVSTIDRVEYQGSAIAIVTSEGSFEHPPALAYGSLVEPVIAAITAAIQNRYPETVVRKRKSVESVSLMRRFGQLIGAILRLFRK